jgi:hypothetical protein
MTKRYTAAGIIILAFLVLSLAACDSYNLSFQNFFETPAAYIGSGIGGASYWARTAVAGTGTSSFNAMAVDGAGNVYAAGNQSGVGPFDYGNGASAAGGSSNTNVVLVKYNTAGNALWAKTVVTGSDSSKFSAVAVDGAGNVYAAGSKFLAGFFDFGNGATVTGGASGDNILLVKYNAAGTAQWAKTVIGGGSLFTAVAADGAGNVYAAGNHLGVGPFDYGDGAIASGGSSGANVVLVKYSAGGNTQWVRTVEAGLANSGFYAVAASGTAVYAAGYQTGTTAYTYETTPPVTASGGGSSGANSVLVKYNTATGTAQWAKSAAGTGTSVFNAVAVDGAGNVYAAGNQTGVGPFDYRDGVITATGGYSGGSNAVLVKYNATGTTLWAKTIVTGPNASTFHAVVVDTAGNIYAAGYQDGTGFFDYGGGPVAGPSSQNAVLVKYNGSGTVLWTKTVTASSGAPDASVFRAVAADGTAVYAAGSQDDIWIYNYGNATKPVTAQGIASGSNAVLVKYPKD